MPRGGRNNLVGLRGLLWTLTLLTVLLLRPSAGLGQPAVIEGMGDLRLCMSRDAFLRGPGKSFQKKYGVLQREGNWSLGNRYFPAKTTVSFLKDKLAWIEWRVEATDPVLSGRVYDTLKAQLLKQYPRRQFYVQDDSAAMFPSLLIGDALGNRAVLKEAFGASVTYTARGYRERAHWLKQQPQFCL